jgi:hypothetical protein
MSNTELARRLGRTKKAVRHRRLSLGIFNRPANRRWTAAELRLLGTLPDLKVAALTGRSLLAIRTRRITILHLPCISAKGRGWTLQEDQLLGKFSDGDLARRFSCSVGTVASRRQKLSVPRFRRSPPWTASEDQLLGTDSDPKIALKLGRTDKDVTARRHMLSIPARPMDRQEISRRIRQYWADRKRKLGPCVVDPDDKPWLPEHDQLLGTLPDEMLARKLGRSSRAVAWRRQERQISPVGRKVRPWMSAEEQRLGTEADAVLAGQLQRSAVDVRWRRQALGIKPFAAGAAKPWTDAELRLVGTKSDQAIAQQLGRTKQAVKYKRQQLHRPAVVDQHWTAPELALLGTMRDEKLARKIGRAVSSVLSHRNKRGIPCFQSRQKLWRPEDDKILGTRPDDQVAALLGRSTYAVATRRRGHGIPIFQSTAKRP